VSVQAFVGKTVSSIEVDGDDLGMGPRPSKDMAVSPEDPLAKQTSLPKIWVT